MAKQFVVLLLELDTAILKECGLADKEFEELPVKIAKAVTRVAPKGVTPQAVYFLSTREKNKVEAVLEAHAMNFSEAVLNFGTKTSAETSCTVIYLDSHRRKQRH